MKCRQYSCLPLLILSFILPGCKNEKRFEEQELYTNAYTVPPSFLSGAAPGSSTDPFSPNAESPLTARELLEKAGVTFGPGSGVFQGGTSQLIVKNTPEELDLVEAYIASLKEGAEKEILVRIDIFESSRAEISGLTRAIEGEGDQKKILDSILQMVQEQKATHRSSTLVKARSGNRSKSVTGGEITWLSEYENKSNTWIPVWESKEFGTILDIDLVLGADNQTIDLNVNLEYHYLPPEIRNSVSKTENSGNVLNIDLPKFHYTNIQSQMTMESGHTRILGVFDSQSLAIPENSYIAFITAGIWKTSVYRKNFDEENSKHEQNPNLQGE